MKRLEGLQSMLSDILSSKPPRTDKVFEFMITMFAQKHVSLTPDIEELLFNLAHDLDDYEANPDWRSHCADYYGEERLDELIREALDKLQTMTKDS